MLDEKAVKKHYEKLAGRVTNWLVANGAAYASACDIVQETFVRLWENRKKMDGDAAVSGFVFITARHLYIDELRRNKKLVLKDTLDENEGGVFIPDETRADADYLRKRLRAALDTLPDDMRQAYTLFQIGGCSIREIAAMTKASESAVKVRIFRAKEKLRVALADLKDF